MDVKLRWKLMGTFFFEGKLMGTRVRVGSNGPVYSHVTESWWLQHLPVGSHGPVYSHVTDSVFNKLRLIYVEPSGLRVELENRRQTVEFKFKN
jgi:hypothetical protein